jgi:hypothetical protein
MVCSRGRKDFAVSACLGRVCRRLRSAQNREKPLFRPMLTFAYAGARFVSARKRVSKPARDDVSCDNSRAERVGDWRARCRR